MEIVARMIGKDCFPVSKMTERFKPKPSRMTAYCSTFLDTNVMPLWNCVLSLSSSVISIPARIPNTGPPTTGTACPRNQQGMARTRHNRMPFTFF